MKLPVASSRQILKALAKLVGDHKRIVFVVVALQLGAALTGAGIPWIVNYALNQISAGTDAKTIATLIGVALALVAVGAILAYFAEYFSKIMGERIFAQLRESLVHSVTNLPLSTVEEAGTGDLLGRTTRDVEQVQFMIRNGLSAIMVLTTTIVVTVVAAFLMSPLLALAMFLPYLPVHLVMRWYLPRTIPAYRAQASAWARISGVITETIENAETVDALGLGALRNRRLDEAVREGWRLERYTAWQRSFLMFGIELAVQLPVAVVMVAGAYLMSIDWVTDGQVVGVALYALQIRGPIWNFTFWIDHMQSAQAALARIFGVGLVEGDRQPTGEVPQSTHVVADQVRYAYREGKDVLHGVSLDLIPGETLAIVGPSGAGKSTFGRMIAGIHPPNGGSVTVGGVNLVDLEEAELQRQVVLVSQEHHVFVGTIADNLRLAKEDATESEMWEALRAVGAASWVEALEEGLDREVGAGGLSLSPAEAQQLALARIVLMDPHTLVLDEATSLMDPSAARSLERSLSKVLDGRTVVAIAHRLHTAEDADRVAVMIDGRVAELGSHTELVHHGGEYASLWESWQKS